MCRHSPRGGFLSAVVVILGAGATLHAADVTAPEERKKSLLAYIAERDDLTSHHKAAWERAIRLTFGGSALRDGTHEGITVAKSVISSAIFYNIDPVRGAKAAYEAYHDTARWIPPPVAINYQTLAFQGRKPKATSRELAFHFPRYFNADLAPELAHWWDEMLTKGTVNPQEEREIRQTLRQTRDLMRPQMRELLYRGAELEVRLQEKPGPDVREALSQLRAELRKYYGKVAHTAEVNQDGPMYPRYVALSRELGLRPQPPPRVVPPSTPPPRVTAPPPPPPSQPSTPAPSTPGFVKDESPPASEPAQPTGPSTQLQKRPESEVTPPPPPRAQGLVPAPLPGDPLVTIHGDYVATLEGVVKEWLGVPYLWGGVTKRGVDCSGYSRATYRAALSIELPRSSVSQSLTGRKVARAELQPGDLLFFDTLDRGRVTHVGIYLGNGMFTHASSSHGVVTVRLNTPYYNRAYRGSRRLIAPAH